MTKETSGEYIRRLREEKNLLLLADTINANYEKLEYLENGLGEVINQLKKKKSNAN